ncbi:hypothetical protein SAMN05444380_11579 [Thermophagus xiamenensis]|uniref:Uncharacterized protein n=1 Tax=Thermophagus xiamenensis TaxID=385682 RepID=A0A1I2CAI2_9BACT|nr:hypothetical protein SAMN05444380_11579 [Thermophagus xiamenensis]
MVRLKLNSFIVSIEPSSYFNSTMVRLKQDNDIKQLAEEIFQFHYGSIEAPTGLG